MHKLITRWLTTKQAAEYLGCSTAFLEKDRVNRLHDIPYTKLGRHIRYNIIDLDTWLEQNKTANTLTAENAQ